MAISIDWYIAKSDYSTDWVFDSDFAMLEEKLTQVDTIILWNTTFKETWAYDDVRNIVLSSEESVSSDENVSFAKNTSEAMDLIKEQRGQDILIIGWWITNATLLKNKFIDEVIISIHPIILGKGIKLFENLEFLQQLETLSVKKYDDGLVHIHYKIKK